MVKVALTLSIVVEKREDCPRKKRALQHVFRQAARGHRSAWKLKNDQPWEFPLFFGDFCPNGQKRAPFNRFPTRDDTAKGGR